MDLRRGSKGFPPLTSINGAVASTDEERRGEQAAPDAQCSSRPQHKDKQWQQHLLSFSTRTSSGCDSSRCNHVEEEDDAQQQQQFKVRPLPSPLSLIPPTSLALKNSSSPIRCVSSSVYIQAS